MPVGIADQGPHHCVRIRTQQGRYGVRRDASAERLGRQLDELCILQVGHTEGAGGFHSGELSTPLDAPSHNCSSRNRTFSATTHSSMTVDARDTTSRRDPTGEADGGSPRRSLGDLGQGPLLGGWQLQLNLGRPDPARFQSVGHTTMFNLTPRREAHVQALTGSQYTSSSNMHTRLPKSLLHNSQAIMSKG